MVWQTNGNLSLFTFIQVHRHSSSEHVDVIESWKCPRLDSKFLKADHGSMLNMNCQCIQVHTSVHTPCRCQVGQFKNYTYNVHEPKLQKTFTLHWPCEHIYDLFRYMQCRKHITGSINVSVDRVRPFNENIKIRAYIVEESCPLPVQMPVCTRVYVLVTVGTIPTTKSVLVPECQISKQVYPDWKYISHFKQMLYN